MANVNSPGRAKPHSRMFKRGYLVNLIPNKRTEKPPGKPSEKKGSSSGCFPYSIFSPASSSLAFMVREFGRHFG
jgi:hypothetical protein